MSLVEKKAFYVGSGRLLTLVWNWLRCRRRRKSCIYYVGYTIDI